jgi:hypothetical protein
MEPSRRDNPRRGGGRGRDRNSGFSGPQPLKKPSFRLVEEVCPEMTGINIRLKVQSQKAEKEFLMGDNTGSVIVVVNNDAAPFGNMREGASVIIRNAFVVMKSDAFINLTVNEWGKVELAAEAFDFTVKKGNNISDVEYTIE